MSFHDTKSPVARLLIGWAGVTASLVMLCVSGFLNFRYGYTLGASQLEGLGIGLAAVSADVFMAIALFFALAAWRKKEYAKSFGGFTLWFCMTAICTWSAVSQISFNRIEATADREVVAINFDDLRKELADARAALGFIPQHRPEAVVKADIDGLKNRPFWTQTGECEGEVNGRQAREFCQSFQRLKSELGSALEGAKIRAKIESLVAKSERTVETKGAKVMSEGDAGAKTWSNLTGMSVRTTQSVAATLFAGMLLVGTGIGLWISVGTLREVREAKPASVIDITPVEVAGRLPPPIPEKPAPTPPGQAPAAGGGFLAAVLPQRKNARPEPNFEAREMLTMIGFPTAPIRGQQLREKDPVEHGAWRFLAWIAAYGLGGTYKPEEVDQLYGEFCQADHRQPLAMRLLKSQLAAIRFCSSKTVAGKVVWEIAPPKVDKLVEALQKAPRGNPVIKASAKADEGSSVVAFRK